MDGSVGDIRSLKEKYKKHLESTLRQPSHITSEDKARKPVSKKPKIPKYVKSTAQADEAPATRQTTKTPIISASDLAAENIDTTVEAAEVTVKEAATQISTESAEDAAPLERKRKGKEIMQSPRIKIVRRTPPQASDPINLEADREHGEKPSARENVAPQHTESPKSRADDAGQSTETGGEDPSQAPPASYTEEFILRFAEGSGIFRNPAEALKQFDNINIMEDEDDMDRLGAEVCNETLLHCALKCYFLGRHQQDRMNRLQRSNNYAKSLAEDRAQDLTQVRKRLGASEAEKASLQSEVEMLKNQLRKKDMLLKSYEQKAADLEKSLDSERGTRQELEETLKTTQNLRARAIEMAESAQNQMQELKTNLSQTQKHMEEAETFGKACCTTHLALRRTISRLQAEVVKQRQINHRLAERVESIKDETLACKTVELYRQHAEGKTEHWDLAEAEEIYASLKSIFEQSLKGELVNPFPPEASAAHVEKEFPLPTAPKIPHRISRSVVQSVILPSSS